MRRAGPLVVLCLFAGPGWAASPDPDPKSLAAVKKDIFFLAGPECEGRGTETKGILKAGEYVADTFKAAGLKPAGTDGYFQPFSIAGPARLGTPNTLALTGPDGKVTDLAYGKDFNPTAMSATGKASAGLVFVGYGISAPKLEYDDYAGLDVAGKVVVMLRRTPRADTKDNKFDAADGQVAAIATKVALAKEKKAAAVVLVNDGTYAKNGDPLIGFNLSGPAAGFPVVHCKRDVLDKLLAAQKTSLADTEKAIDKDVKPRSAVLTGWSAAVETTVTRGGLPARNVVAVAEGAGPFADETVVVGAHYDHLGFGESGSLGGRDGKGKVHYGADDNGSGTTGLLELARRIGGMTNRQGRRIVFVAFAGEERGLFGSIHYCKQPAFPLDKTVFMVNMDMIGRVTPVDDKPAPKTAEGPNAKPDPDAPPPAKKDRLLVYGTGTTDGLDAVVEAVNGAYDFKLLKLPTGRGPSDHESFYLKKIPVLFFFTGTHKDYHRPSDTPDKINLPGLLKVVGFAEACLLHYAAAPVRPKFVATKQGWEDPTEERSASPRAGMPKLGIMPGNYEATDGGVLVEGLSPGGAAEKGGLKEKDVIVSVGGKPVKDIQTYMTAMQAQKAGQETEIVVQRGEKKVTLKVTPTP